MKEGIVRSTELVMTLVSSYLASITFIQTTLYASAISWVRMRIAEELIPFLNHLDLLIIAASIALSVILWRRGTEASFARIFMMNMFLYFPAVLDFSIFNWVALIFGLVPRGELSTMWVFSVGLILQVTYLWLRHTIRIRFTREELQKRGALEEDLDKITGGQMWYLGTLSSGASLISILIYLAIPYIQSLLMGRIHEIPNPHIVIGILSALLLSGTLIFYLRGSSIENREKSGATSITKGERGASQNGGNQNDQK